MQPPVPDLRSLQIVAAVADSGSMLEASRQFGMTQSAVSQAVRRAEAAVPVGRSKSPGYGHLKLPHLMIAVSAAEQQ
ncbi:helix-turn-helix domain-containing protein [Bradyrhizobium barranii]